MAQLYDEIVIRNGTEAQWIEADPILLEGEVGITMDLTPKKYKIGDGVSAWSTLHYETSTPSITDIPGLQDALNAKEPSFTKNTGFNKNFGSTAGTVCEGDDDRLSDSRNPLSHNHIIDNITNLQSELDSKSDVDSVYNISEMNILLAAKSDTSHTHDDRYYTETEINSLLDNYEPANANIQTHIANTDIHITSEERSTWNSKADTSDIPTKLSELTKDINFDERYYTEIEIDAKIGNIETLLGAI